MSKAKNVIRKLIIGLIGYPLLVIGIILIPLPGPGLLISFIAFFILSFEFEWSATYFEKTKAELKKIYDKSKLNDINK